MILYGSNVASTLLPTACTLVANAVGGTEVGAQTVMPSGTGRDYAEIWSKGNSALPTASVFSSLPAPQGNGWVYKPGAGSFAAGNWSAGVALAVAQSVTGDTVTLRFYKYSGGTYTAIGSITASLASGTTAKQSLSFAATALPLTAFGASDLLYCDLILYDPNGPGADNPTVYESNSATAGVANDLQITTSPFTTGVTVTRHRRVHHGFGRSR